MDPLTITRLTGISQIDLGTIAILQRLGLAALIAVVVALCYRRTHKSYAYSYNMVAAIIMISLIVCTVLMVIDNSLSRAFGLVGALAIIRFRTPVKDVRDIVFLFLAVGNGIACGAGAFKIALIGGLSTCVAGLVLYASHFGDPRLSKALLLKLSFDPGHVAGSGNAFDDCLASFADSYKLIEMHAGAAGSHEALYSLQLSDAEKLPVLLEDLKSTAGVTSATALSTLHNLDVQ